MKTPKPERACYDHEKPQDRCTNCMAATIRKQESLIEGQTKEIALLQKKVAFWNEAWHEQRILTGVSFWRTPYKG